MAFATGTVVHRDAQHSRGERDKPPLVITRKHDKKKKRDAPKYPAPDGAK
jgi:hypothetical protein